MESCIACSSPLREGARYCTRCGTAIAPRPSIAFVEDAPPPPVLEVAAAPAESASPAATPAPPTSPVAMPAEPAVPAAMPAEPAGPVATPVDSVDPDPEPAVPARIPPSAPPATAPFSRAAGASLLAGVSPLLISIGGNALATLFGLQAVEAINAGRPEGAWAPFLTTLTLLFLVNAALLVLCGVLGLRALRQTRGGAMRGRPFAVAGLATGGVNLVLWVVGLAVTLVRYSAILS
jgi:hypothetical protein